MLPIRVGRFAAADLRARWRAALLTPRSEELHHTVARLMGDLQSRRSTVAERCSPLRSTESFQAQTRNDPRESLDHQFPAGLTSRVVVVVAHDLTDAVVGGLVARL